MIRNPFSRWQALNPAPARRVALVVSRDSTANTSQVRVPPLSTGTLLTAQGADYPPGSHVLLRGTDITGQASELPLVEVEV